MMMRCPSCGGPEADRGLVAPYQPATAGARAYGPPWAIARLRARLEAKEQEQAHVCSCHHPYHGPCPDCKTPEAAQRREARDLARAASFKEVA